MHPLSQSENKNFYFSGKGNLFNRNSENCLLHIKDNIDRSIEDVDLYFYPSGALYEEKNSAGICLIYFMNNSERLFTIKKEELNEKSNRIYDINAIACGTGVLVAYRYYDKKEYYEYYLYNKTMICDSDLANLQKRVKAYEHLFGIYYGEPVKVKTHNEATEHIFKCLGQELEEK